MPPDPLRRAALVPVLHHGVLILTDPALHPTVESTDGAPPALMPAGLPGRWLADPLPAGRIVLQLARPDGTALTAAFRAGGWAGGVDWVLGGAVAGWARDLHAPDRDVQVVAFGPQGTVAAATATAAGGGRFLLILPAGISRAGLPCDLRIGIAGSDFILDGGRIAAGGPAAPAPTLTFLPRPAAALGIRIKISTPNLKEAPLWGDWHFARSLAGAFERIGHAAGVDTADAWYGTGVAEDVMLMIRGRHRIRTDPGRINVMWLISHPDRIPDEEFADYDHVAVASDIFAARLRARGLPSVSVLHQATDPHLFRPPPADVPRARTSLFVGNSRREYRTMVKWCLQKNLALDLYGGGWEGVVPPGLVRATSVANADLGALYGRHALLLNDHWDSMRTEGFLSNRLFDGSATGTPILSDPVAGLADVFGDTIATAGDAEGFAARVADCLADPAPWLARAERARDIVMGAHTFDHRARQLADLIDRIATLRARAG